MSKDTITVTILDDGTLKTETDKISMPSHHNAEMFIREMGRLAGGPVEVKHKHGHTWHSHSQEHEAQH